MDKIPEWPKRVRWAYSQTHNGITVYDGKSLHDVVNYERARADAAIERLKVAVNELELIASGNPQNAFVSGARAALAIIGEIPE